MCPEEWEKKAAARVFHISASGRDIEIDDPFAPGPATQKPIRYLCLSQIRSAHNGDAPRTGRLSIATNGLDSA